ncbi:OmpA family protein [Cognatiyoonia sp. IB215446]|uniref:OmpA family protein n=1 Tax=Cognatiyoonia sp. IB215446 TaxID=3097355 RepID=UPI002A183FB6|nr:OmpA family protein [Cognatiyoonia sp. IB215446]MDX8348032.1 OmpA family protein [Cognatiyoonia sp. IB215446]
MNNARTFTALSLIALAGAATALPFDATDAAEALQRETAILEATGATPSTEPVAIFPAMPEVEIAVPQEELTLPATQAIEEVAAAAVNDITPPAIDVAAQAPETVAPVLDVAPPAVDLVALAETHDALAVRKGEDGEADAMMMLSDVLFSFGDDRLEPAAVSLLEELAPELEGATALQIAGHTDAIGDEVSNQELGLRRANAVRDWLIANSALSADVVTATGIGEVDPVADNLRADGSDNPEGRALNRRVEFLLPDAG